MFSASSADYTASCKDIFYMDIPYLRSQPVRHDASSDPNYSNAKVFTISQLKTKLESAFKVKLTGSPYDWIKTELGDGGYVAYVTIGGTVRVKGNDLRVALGLKSPKFEFVYQDSSDASGRMTVTSAAGHYLDTGATHATIYTSFTTTSSTSSETETDPTTITQDEIDLTYGPSDYTVDWTTGSTDSTG